MLDAINNIVTLHDKCTTYMILLGQHACCYFWYLEICEWIKDESLLMLLLFVHFPRVTKNTLGERERQFCNIKHKICFQTTQLAPIKTKKKQVIATCLHNFQGYSSEFCWETAKFRCTINCRHKTVSKMWSFYSTNPPFRDTFRTLVDL